MLNRQLLSRLSFCCLFFLGLGGCTLLDTHVAVNVTSFHSYLQPPGKTYAIVPQQAELGNSLEFRSYASHVAAAMNQLGYLPEPDANKTPDLLVVFKYTMLPPELTQEQVVENIQQPGGAYINHLPATTITTTQQCILRTRYPKQVKIDILDGHGGVQPQKFFEGTAVTYHYGQNMAKAMPSLVKALLLNPKISTSGMKRELHVVYPAKEGERPYVVAP